MKTFETGIEGCVVVEAFSLRDERGSFCKPYHRDDFLKNGIDFTITEQFYSVSAKNVLRGMHFQLPPKATAKLITCLEGKVFDVVVDLRKSSPTFMAVFSVELKEGDSKMLYIPEGLAHGFCSLEDNSTLLYLCSEVYSPEHDSGVKWDSVNINWPVNDPLISERDQGLVRFENFDNPF